MKQIVFFLLFLFSINIVAQQFKFKKEVIDYGTIAKNANGKRIFEFKNIGTKPLKIDHISSSCGCTIPKKPTKAIAPDATGKIEVLYDTKKIGGFSKSIIIYSNAIEKRKVIKIKGRVVKQILPIREKSMMSNSI